MPRTRSLSAPAIMTHRSYNNEIQKNTSKWKGHVYSAPGQPQQMNPVWIEAYFKLHGAAEAPQIFFGPVYSSSQ